MRAFSLFWESLEWRRVTPSIRPEMAGPWTSRGQDSTPVAQRGNGGRDRGADIRPRRRRRRLSRRRARNPAHPRGRKRALCHHQPAYWGLRDYGTGEWEGGDAGCDHVQTVMRPSDKSTLEDHGADGRSPQLDALPGIPYRDTCAKCGARRQDRQLGLETTPDEYVHRMVEVFRELRRVLRRDGTCWLNIGDSYSGGQTGRNDHGSNGPTVKLAGNSPGAQPPGPVRPRPRPPGLKPKDLDGIPWRLAFALQADGWYLRADIIWAKPNPMPESVTDRPTKAHEYLFLLAKSERYYYDAEAIKEDSAGYSRKGGSAPWTADSGHTNGIGSSTFHQMADGHRNRRSVWT